MNKFTIIFLIILFVGGCVGYEIYNWNTPYEITSYGAHGQVS